MSPIFMGQESKKKSGNGAENMLVPLPIPYIIHILGYIMHACETYYTAYTTVSLRMKPRS